MSQVAIRSIITTALEAWATTNSITLVREGQSLPEKPDGTFVELFVIPSDTVTASLSGTRKRYLGEVVINIWVMDGEGTGEAESLAEDIATLFPVVPKTYLPVSIEQTPSIKRSVLDDSGYRITPVVFNYRAEY